MTKLVHSVAIRADDHGVMALERHGRTEGIAKVAGPQCGPTLRQDQDRRTSDPAARAP